MKKAKFACCLLAYLVFGSPAWPQDMRSQIEQIIKEYVQKNPQDIQQVVKEYIVNNPDVIQQIIVDSLNKQRPTGASAREAKLSPDKSAAIKENAPAIFTSTHQVTLGNPKGDVTLVEFFDYSCGFCKRALADKLELLKSDPNLKLVLKDYPILGPNSLEAARVAIAVRMQDGGGPRYFEFHSKMLGDRLPVSRERAVAVAVEAGFDIGKIEASLNSEEVNQTLAENRNLARVLGINGTPSYVIGDQVFVGAVGAATLKEKIKSIRSQ